MSSNKIYIRTSRGGGFWVDKDEYESTYAGAKGVKTGQEEPKEKNDTSVKSDNKWEYPGVADQINKLQTRLNDFATLERDGKESYIKLRHVAEALKSVRGQLKVVEEAIRTEGENTHLLTYRRKLRMMERKLKSGKFND